MMNTNNTEKELTGYPSIGKPWLNRYVIKPLITINPENTLYDLYATTSQDKKHNIAIYSFTNGTKYTHAELLDLIDKAACGFLSLGLKAGMKAVCFLNNTYETPITLLALNKLGVMVQFLDWTKSPQYIVDSTSVSDPDAYIIDETLIELGRMINTKHRPMILANATHEELDDCISFEKLLLLGNSHTSLVREKYISNKPSVIITSSGTTGAPKPIVHTDYSINSAVNKMLHSNYPLNSDNLLINVIPPHICLGLVTSLFTGLISGTPVVMIAGYSPEDSVVQTLKFINGFKEFCINNNLTSDVNALFFASPIFYRVIFAQGSLNDMSFIKAMLAAGSKMTEDELKALCELAKSKGCTVPICNGYGQNEMCGAITLNDNLYNRNGSAGYPTWGTEICIIDVDTHKPLPANEIGKILERSDSEFLGYEKMPERTEESKIYLSNGSIWFDTKDLGFMSEDGFLYITGRESRVVIKSDVKIPIDVIEEKIRQFPEIEDCAIVIKPNSINEDLIAYVIVKENINLNQFHQVLQDSKLLSDFEMPSMVKAIKNSPLLSSGKIDYRKLERMLED